MTEIKPSSFNIGGGNSLFCILYYWDLSSLDLVPWSHWVAFSDFELLSWAELGMLSVLTYDNSALGCSCSRPDVVEYPTYC